MRFRKRETDLERELRAQRPVPREEFVRSLSKLVEPAARPRRTGLPKVALVAAVTVVLAASLGATGALGAAGGSFHSFGLSISHLISPAKQNAVHTTHIAITAPTTNSTSKTSTSTSSTSSSAPTGSIFNPPSSPNYSPTPDFGTSPSGAPLGVSGFPLPSPNQYPSFFPQYGYQIPICYKGQIIKVSPFQLIWYLFHGAQPWWRCYH